MRPPADRSSGVRNKAIACYSLAALAPIVALYLHFVLARIVGAKSPSYTVWSAIVFSAWSYGLFPSMVTSTVCIVGVWCWFLRPTDCFHVYSQEVFQGSGFVLLSGLMVFIGNVTRGSEAKLAYAQ